jgi:hypothetical protein
MPGKLSVLVPGLLGPPALLVDRTRWLQAATQALDVSSIQRLLERAEPIEDACADLSLEGMVCRAFSLQPGEHGDWPIGAICYLGDGGGLESNACYLRADPVFVRPGLAEVSLRVADDIGITSDEAVALCAELNAHFDGQPARIEAPNPARWYLRCDANPLLASPPPSLAAAGLVEELFPAGNEARQWRGWLNEVQMVLHASPVNERRVARGDVPVNSLWLWGAGERLPVSSAWSRVSGDHFLAKALAGAANIRYQSLPESLADWTAGEASGPRHDLLVVSSLYALALNQDIEGWRQQMQALEEAWFSGLVRGLTNAGYDSIDIHPGFGTAYRTTKSRQKRFWKRSRLLPSLVEPED